jgi:hypothetical protein
MKVSKEELIQLLSDQKDLELMAVESLSKLTEMSKNHVVKLLLLGVMQDSKKHAQVLEALINLTQTPTFGDVEKYEIARGVEKHIKIEEDMLRKTNEIIEKAEEQEIKGILGQIAMEEKRHHRTLIDLNNMIERIDRVTEEDWWDYLNQWSNFST